MRINNCSIVATISVTAVLFGCAGVPEVHQSKPPKTLSHHLPKDLIIPDSSDFGAHGNLTRAMVEDDLSLLIYAFERGYGGRDFIDQGIVRTVLSGLGSLAERLQYPTDSRELLERIDEQLLLIPDNHLGLESLELGGSKLRAERERKASVGMNTAVPPKGSVSARKPWHLEIITENGMTLPALGLRWFAGGGDEAWRGFEQSVEKWLRGPVAVLDLRGNGGGSDVMAHWLASRILGRQVLPPYEYFARRVTPETMAMRVNAIKFDIMMKRFQKATVSKGLLGDLADATQEFEKALTDQANGYEKVVFDKPRGVAKAKSYTGMVYILIDSGCASTCESLVKLLENDTHVMTVGENSAGAFHFGNIGFVLLPHSQLLVKMGTGHFKARDGGFIEMNGIKPRIQVPPGDDALGFLARSVLKTH